jgi:hypothetical protein
MQFPLCVIVVISSPVMRAVVSEVRGGGCTAAGMVLLSCFVNAMLSATRHLPPATCLLLNKEL